MRALSLLSVCIALVAGSVSAQSVVFVPTPQRAVESKNASAISRNALFDQKQALQQRNRCVEQQEEENLRAERAGEVPTITICGTRERGDEIPQVRVLTDDVTAAQKRPLALGVRDAIPGVPMHGGPTTRWDNIQAWLR